MGHDWPLQILICNSSDPTDYFYLWKGLPLPQPKVSPEMLLLGDTAPQATICGGGEIYRTEPREVSAKKCTPYPCRCSGEQQNHTGEQTWDKRTSMSPADHAGFAAFQATAPDRVQNVQSTHRKSVIQGVNASLAIRYCP